MINRRHFIPNAIFGAISTCGVVDALAKEIDYPNDFKMGSRVSLNVKNFGALGDGISDDSQSIQSAMDDANGGWVYFPKGIYLIRKSLVFRNELGVPRLAGLKIYGDGKRNSRLINRVKDGFAIDIDTGVGSSTGNYFFSYGGKILDISIEGDSLTSNSGGIRLKSCWEYELECDIVFHTAAGLKITGNKQLNPDFTASANITLNRCRICENRVGVVADMDNIAPLLTLNSCNISSNLIFGISNNSSYLTLAGGTVSYNGSGSDTNDDTDGNAGGVLVPQGKYDPKGISIAGVEFDNNKPLHIKISQAKSPRIVSCSFQSGLKDNFLNPYSIVLGEQISIYNKYVEDWLIESNNFQLPSDLQGYRLPHVFVKTKSFVRNGLLGYNSYSISNGKSGVNFLYISEDKRISPFDRPEWRSIIRQQGGSTSTDAYDLQIKKNPLGGRDINGSIFN